MQYNKKTSALIHFCLIRRSAKAQEIWKNTLKKAPFVILPTFLDSFAEAEEHIEKHGVRWMLLGDEAGTDVALDFIANVRSYDARVRTIFTSNQNLPLVVTEPLGIVSVINPEDEINQSESLILKLKPSVNTSSSFEGSLEHIPIVDLIQIYCMRQKKDALKIVSPEAEAFVYFNEYGICHCKIGSLEGLEAFNALVYWTTGRFENLPDVQASMNSIPGRWEGVLMNALSLKDESNALVS